MTTSKCNHFLQSHVFVGRKLLFDDEQRVRGAYQTGLSLHAHSCLFCEGKKHIFLFSPHAAYGWVTCLRREVFSQTREVTVSCDGADKLIVLCCATSNQTGRIPRCSNLCCSQLQSEVHTMELFHLRSLKREWTRTKALVTSAPRRLLFVLRRETRGGSPRCLLCEMNRLTVVFLPRRSDPSQVGHTLFIRRRAGRAACCRCDWQWI